MPTNIDTLSTFKALEQSRIHRNVTLLDHVLTTPEAAEQLGLKRIQFESHPAMSERLESICNLLDVSKREFLECAVVDAMTRAEEKFAAVYREATGREFGEED